MSKIVLVREDFEAFWEATVRYYELDPQGVMHNANHVAFFDQAITRLLYTSPSPRDAESSRMPSSA